MKLIIFVFFFATLNLFSLDLVDLQKYESNPSYRSFVDLFKIPKTIQDPSPFFSEAKDLIQNFNGFDLNNHKYAAFDDRISSNLNEKYRILIGDNGSIYSLYIHADKTGTMFKEFIKNEYSFVERILDPEWLSLHSEFVNIGDTWSIRILYKDVIIIFHKCYYIALIPYVKDDNMLEIAREVVNYLDKKSPGFSVPVNNQEPFKSLRNPEMITELKRKWSDESNENLNTEILNSTKAITYDDTEKKIVDELSEKIKSNPSNKLVDNQLQKRVKLNDIVRMGLIKTPYGSTGLKKNDFEKANGFVQYFKVKGKGKEKEEKYVSLRIGIIYGLSESDSIESLAALRVLYSCLQIQSIFLPEEDYVEIMQDYVRRFAKSSISLGDRCFQGTDPRTSDLTPLKKRGYELFFLVGNTAVMVVSDNENAVDIVLEIATQIEQALTGEKKSFTPLKTVSGQADSMK